MAADLVAMFEGGRSQMFPLGIPRAESFQGSCAVLPGPNCPSSDNSAAYLDYNWELELACMESGHRARLNKNLKEKGLRSAAILPLGFRDVSNDWLVNLKKVRTPKEKFITEIK